MEKTIIANYIEDYDIDDLAEIYGEYDPGDLEGIKDEEGEDEQILIEMLIKSKFLSYCLSTPPTAIIFRKNLINKRSQDIVAFMTFQSINSDQDIKIFQPINWNIYSDEADFITSTIFGLVDFAKKENFQKMIVQIKTEEEYLAYLNAGFTDFNKNHFNSASLNDLLQGDDVKNRLMYIEL